ncbi:hypothetical protein LWC34_29705 [Kibdelosporangium philippinense]|uniref:3-methyl-2-oxobutanoate hydroxymethyltransferase n=1 Tax=Kibdelosporangium philippinense TaxID=211113 RepID=A0ABS8ZIN7_9PSEU|nr:hypothetical protein [Kibdelosporangium philippinense]MCE7006973.1 hypothetical protein [Kibdelosporangium philippinense]
MKPILLNSCARAATTAEARFRIDAPIAPARATRVIALDHRAEAVVHRVAGQPWADARFFTCKSPAGNGSSSNVADLVLISSDGSESRLSEVLTGADVVVMVATENDGATAASAIGDACTLRGIMTAGLVLAGSHDAGAAVSALRPHARVIMVTYDEHDVSEVLTALRA